MNNTIERSRILLLSIKPQDTNHKHLKVSMDLLKMIFSRFGTLSKVAVTSRKAQFKALLAFETFESAAAAKATINQKVLSKIGLVRIFYSPLQELDRPHQYLEVWVNFYRSKFSHQNENVRTKSSLISSRSVNSSKGSLWGQGYGQGRCFTLEKLAVPISNVNKFSTEKPHRDTGLTMSKRMAEYEFSSRPREFNAVAEESLLSALDSLDDSQNQADVKQDIHPTMTISRVVDVSNAGGLFVDAREVFNLFSSFGSVRKVLFLKELGKALVEYNSVLEATEAIVNLHNLSIDGLRLSTQYSRYKTIDLERLNYRGTLLSATQVIIVPSETCNRRSLHPVAPISTSLVVSCLGVHRPQQYDIYRAIERVATPIKTKLIINKNDNSPREAVNMLFSFKNIQSAVYVLLKCHNLRVGGGVLDVFFV